MRIVRGAQRQVEETLIWQHYCGSVAVRPAARGAMWCPKCGMSGQHWWRVYYTSKPSLVRAAVRGRLRLVWLRRWLRVETPLRWLVIGVGVVLWAWFFLLIGRILAAAL